MQARFKLFYSAIGLAPEIKLIMMMINALITPICKAKS